MNETAKKILLGVVIVAGLACAVYGGVHAFKEPTLVPAYTIGGGKPGHGMKAAEREEMAAGKAGTAPAEAAGGDPLAGPNPGK